METALLQVAVEILKAPSGDLGGTVGTAPPNLRWGTAHASVLQIFREVVLLDAWQSTN